MKNNPFVFIEPIDNKIQITWAFNTLRNKEVDGKFSCYIPAFDLYFSASSEDVIKIKGAAITRLFFDNFLIHDKKRGLKHLALELNKRGFKADMNAMVMKSFVNEKVTKAKFKSNEIRPNDFEDSESVHHHSQMELVC